MTIFKKNSLIIFFACSVQVIGMPKLDRDLYNDLPASPKTRTIGTQTEKVSHSDPPSLNIFVTNSAPSSVPLLLFSLIWWTAAHKQTETLENINLWCLMKNASIMQNLSSLLD